MSGIGKVSFLIITMNGHKQKNIFLTGITGFLGSFLAKDLISHGYKVYGLARPGKGINAQDRVKDSLKFVYGEEWDPQKIKNNLKVIEGDIIYPHLGIKDKKDEEELIKEIDIFIHSAALAELNCQYTQIRRINVDGTKYVLDFAMKCKEKGRLKKFNYISTMYIAGKKEMQFDETMYEMGQSFHNTYERTKFEAEDLIRKYLRKGLNCSIFRPSMIVGDSKEGKTSNFRLIYQPLHFFAKGIYDAFPSDLTCGQNLIHIDVVTRAISELADIERADVYHLVSPNETSIKDFIETAADFFNIQMPLFIHPERFDFNELTPAKRILAKQFFPYFAYRTKFKAERTFKIFDELGIPHQEFTKKNLIKIFEFCLKKRFLTKNKLIECP